MQALAPFWRIAPTPQAAVLRLIGTAFATPRITQVKDSYYKTVVNGNIELGLHSGVSAKMSVTKEKSDKQPDKPTSHATQVESTGLSIGAHANKGETYPPKITQEFVIRYRTSPHWLIPVTTTLASAVAFFVVICPMSLIKLLAIPLGTLPMSSSLIMFEICLRALILLILAFLVYVVSESGRHDVIVLSRNGLNFPLAFAASLLFRPKRSWSDIGSILLGAMLVADRTGDYEYELEQAKDKKKLFIYFKSGGHVGLDLNCMSTYAMERLFVAIESWCITYARSPQPFNSKKLASISKVGNLSAKNPSYTQLWDEELQAHFSATNFVPLEKGMKLQNGRITVLMQLASGGLSAVYLVEQANKELAVLKEAALPRTLDESSYQKAKELLAREVTLLRKLSHPRIAKMMDHFVENGRDYLLIEFVPGQTLRQVVRANGPQSEHQILNWARQVAVLIDYLHDQDPPIVHRDVTPDNIIVNEENEIALIDFGAANEFLGTATGTLIGKQCYMAPEQFRGKAAPQSDIYALGGTLHFLLTGVDPEALSVSHPKQIRSDVSDEIDVLIGSCTELELSRRIKSARDLIQEIDLVLPHTFLSFGVKDKEAS